MQRGLLALFASVFLVMTGFGITLPALTFYTERLALEGGIGHQAVSVQVGFLTAAYPLAQLFFAPIWGRYSDRVGRKPLVLLGMAGFALGQLLFGLATSIWTLYLARILGGIFSSAILPVASAYVADITSDAERTRGMAGLGGSASLGVVVGPAMSGLLAREDLHFSFRLGHFFLDRFSVPFLFAASLAVATLLLTLWWLPESWRNSPREPMGAWPIRTVHARELRFLLTLTLLAQFGLATFEGTFALYAQRVLDYSLSEVGFGFVVCGSVMAGFQIGRVFLPRRARELEQINLGLLLMATALALMLFSRATPFVLLLVGLLALGMSFVSPNLYSLFSKSSPGETGAVLGIQNAAISIGQFAGPFAGGMLFAWQAPAPYAIAAAVLVAAAVWAASKRGVFKRRSDIGAESSGPMP